VVLPPLLAIDTTHCVNLDISDGNENSACNPGTTETNLRRKLFETAMRFGRIHLYNAYGSELLPLRVEARAEYWDGSRWTTNTLDSLTAIGLGAVTASGGIAANTCFLTNPPPANPTNASCLANSPATTFANGTAHWYVFDKTSVQTGFADLALTAPTWLDGWWSGAATGYSEDPVARIRFGSSRAPYIYLRERY
jgi:MSHA biogenesis protein MshQ